MVEINETQKNTINNFIANFKNYSKTQEYKLDMEDREEREKFFSGFSKEKFLSMNEFEFGEIISRLWATLIWGNKAYHVDKVISENEFENLKNKLTKLLFDKENLLLNFDDTLNNIKYLGSASITELLCYFFRNPVEFGIIKQGKLWKFLDFLKICL